jgi:hypothetical protein
MRQDAAALAARGMVAAGIGTVALARVYAFWVSSDNLL